MSTLAQPASAGIRYHAFPMELKEEILRWSLYNVEKSTHWTEIISQMIAIIRSFEPQYDSSSIIRIIRAHYQQEIQVFCYGEPGSFTIAELGNLLYYLPNPREEFDPKKYSEACPEYRWLYSLTMLRSIMTAVDKTVQTHFPFIDPSIDIYSACSVLTEFLHLSRRAMTPTLRYTFLEQVPAKQCDNMLNFLAAIIAQLERLLIGGVSLVNQDHADFVAHYQNELISQNIPWKQFVKSGGLRICLYHYILESSPANFWSFLGFNGTDKDVAWFHEIAMWRSFAPKPTLTINRWDHRDTLRLKPCVVLPLIELFSRHNNNYWIFRNRYQSGRTPRFNLSEPIPETVEFEIRIEQPDAAEPCETAKS